MSTIAQFFLLQRGGTLRVTSNSGELTGFSVSTPSIADVRTYNYLYIDIYNPQDKDIDFTISYEWAYPLVKLRANSWTRVVIEVGREVGRYEVGSVAEISNLYLIHAYSSQQGDLKQKISVYDGSFVNEEFAVFNLADGEYVNFGSLYAVNKLPELPAGVYYPVCARVDSNLDDFVVAGHKQVVTFSSVDVEGTLAVTLSIDGGEATAFENNTEYTFATAGIYKFTATVTKSDGTAVTTVKTVRVLESEKGTTLIDLGSAEAMTSSNVSTDGNVSSTLAFSTEKNAMQLTGTGASIEGFKAAGFTANSTIADVRGYKYVYFDVYNDTDRDLELLVGYVWGYPLVKLKANSWTRIVITSGGHLLMLDASSSQQNVVKTKVCINDGNFSGETFMVKGLAANESVYFSSVYVTGELPELPEGYVCGYKGE